MSLMTIQINNNTAFRRVLTKLNDETDLNERVGFDGVIWCKMTKAEFEGLVPEELGNPNKTWGEQFLSRECALYPNRRYVALARDQKSKLSGQFTGSKSYLDPIPPWKFWRWADYFGIDNLFCPEGLPVAEQTV